MPGQFRPGERQQLVEQGAQVRGCGVARGMEHEWQLLGSQQRRWQSQLVEGVPQGWLGNHQDYRRVELCMEWPWTHPCRNEEALIYEPQQSI